MNFTKKSFQLVKLTNLTFKKPFQSQRSHFVTSFFANGCLNKDVTFKNGLLYFDHGQSKFVLSYWTPLNQLSEILQLTASSNGSHLVSNSTSDASVEQEEPLKHPDDQVINYNVTDASGQDVTSSVDVTLPIGKILGEKLSINLLDGVAMTLVLANNSLGQLLTWAKSNDKCGHPTKLSLEQERQALLTKYEPMANEFMSLVEKAELTASNRFKWGGLFLLSTQLGFFARLIWVDYSWDVMEPITWCVTYSMMVATFAYYIIHSQEFMLPLAEKRAVQTRLWKLIQAREAAGQFDLRSFRRLRRKLLAIEASKTASGEQTAFDTMLRSGITG